MGDFETRVGAYAVVVENGQVLLAHFRALGASAWTLPGGGLEFGEDGETAAVREVLEETGYRVALDGLLGVDSLQIPADERLGGRSRHLHSLRLVYQARIIGGELRREAGGSTDDAKWFALESVQYLERVELVDTGIRMWKEGLRTRLRQDLFHAGGGTAEHKD